MEVERERDLDFRFIGASSNRSHSRQFSGTSMYQTTHAHHLADASNNESDDPNPICSVPRLEAQVCQQLLTVLGTPLLHKVTDTD